MTIKSSDKHIIINYHYVENPHPDFSGIRPCSVEKFEKQIKWLCSGFRITSIEDVFEAAHKQSPEKLCSITFDDGLKGQYQNAVPILKKYGATATFFPITSTLDGKLPSTQKMHLLLSRFSSEELVDIANAFFSEHHSKDVQKFHIPKNERITDKRKLRDDVITANFKEAMNILPNDIEKECLEWLFNKLDLNEAQSVKQIFMNEKEIKTLFREGFSIGCHSHNHYALDTQSVDSIQNELRISKEYLSKIVDKSITIMSYPHGGSNDRVISVLKEENFKYAVTIKPGKVTSNDSQLLLPRYDANDVAMDFTPA